VNFASSEAFSERPPVLRVAVLIVGIIAFWAVYALVFKTRCIYAVFEVEFFRKAGFSDVFGMMDFGKYKRFAPLGFGLWGYLDLHVLVPLLGKAQESDAALAEAGRLLWFHLLFLGALCACIAFVSWNLFRDTAITTIIVLLVGLNDAIPFQFRFASTLLCYQLQIITCFTIYFLAAREKTTASFLGIVGCVVVILFVWEQGLNLAVAVGVYLGIVILLEGRKGRLWPKWEIALLLATVTVTLIYVIARIQGGTEESLSNNNEASYFFSYKNPLLMFDDLLLNFSALLEQSIRQLFPFPFESFAVLLGRDMNILNPYNLSYSQFPNMPYRMMGLWFSGFCFSLFWLLLAATAFVARRSTVGRVSLLAVCIFTFGFVLHLPVMHRDYFYIPGYAVGYKGSVSYIGFVFMIGVLLKETNWARLARSASDFGGNVPSLIGFYIAGSAVIRAVALTLPQRFPW
jgi:hypothetical protein